MKAQVPKPVLPHSFSTPSLAARVVYRKFSMGMLGKYRLPQLAPTQAIPSKVICFSERKGITKPEEYWVDFFIVDALFENFWNHPEMSFENPKRFAGIITTVTRLCGCD